MIRLRPPIMRGDRVAPRDHVATIPHYYSNFIIFIPQFSVHRIQKYPKQRKKCCGRLFMLLGDSGKNGSMLRESMMNA